MSHLPRLLLLTDREQAVPRSLVEVARAAAAGGATAVVLREKDLERPAREELAKRLRTEVELLLVASDPTVPAHGVHLAATDAMPIPRPPLVGRSCHTAEEVVAAVNEGCDYITVSPVFPSPSKPGYGPPLGLDGLMGLAAKSPVPVFGLGGINPERVVQCFEAGVYGVAVMGAVMRSPNPTATVELFVKALEQALEAQP